MAIGTYLSIYLYIYIYTHTYIYNLYIYIFLYMYIWRWSRSVVSDSLWPHESQHARPPCPYFKCKWIKCSNQKTQTGWIDTKTRPEYICCLQETQFRPKDTYKPKVREWKNIFHANGKQKKVGVAILRPDKLDLKIKITRDKEGHSIMIKGSIQEEDKQLLICMHST